MKRIILSVIVSVVAVGLVVVHLRFPDLKIDPTTLRLLVVAIIPWLYPVFKSLELPAGLKVEYQDLEKVERKAADAGLLASPAVPEAPAYLNLVSQDPNLALAGLRIVLERELKNLAESKGLNVERQSAQSYSTTRSAEYSFSEGIFGAKRFASSIE